METFNNDFLVELKNEDIRKVNGGETGDTAYWIGRISVYAYAHLLTFGLSTLYLIGKEVLD